MARGHIRQARSVAGQQGKGWAILWRDATGKQRQETVSGTKTQAQKLLTKRLHEADTGVLSDPGRLTVREYLELWYRDVASLRLAPASQYSYRAALDGWIAAIGHRTLAKLHPMHLQEALRLAADAGLAPATIRMRFKVLGTALSHAARIGYLHRNPAEAVELPKERASGARALTAEEAIRLLAAAQDDRRGMLAILALGLGLRVGECCGLQWGDVDLDKGEVWIRRSVQWLDKEYKAPKSGKARLVTAPKFVCIALRAARAQLDADRAKLPFWNPEGLLITNDRGERIFPHAFQTIRRLCKAAKIEPPIRFHDLRHTHATLLLAQGADVKAVSQRLGHADVRITLQVYHHLLDGADQGLADRLDRDLGK